MAQISTAKGVIDTSALGATLMHEHIFVLSPEINQNYPETWGDEECRVRNAVDQLRRLKAGGIDSILDLTVLGAGRCVQRIQRIASQVEINILVATGLYTFSDLPMYLQSRNSGGRCDVGAKLAEMFLRDIREGVAGTGAKAAILKCATDRQGVTWGVDRVLRAVGQSPLIRMLEPGVALINNAYSKRRTSISRVLSSATAGIRRIAIIWKA